MRQLAPEQEPHLAVRSLTTNYGSGYVIESHAHRWHQLLFAATGAMTLQAGRWSWMVPPGKAVFIPAGCAHSIRMWGTVAMRSLYFPRSLDRGADCFVLSVTPLLRELILRVTELSALDSRVPEEARLMSVLLDEMNVAPETPLALPMPEDARAASIAKRVLDDPACDETLDGLSRRYGIGRRTAERLFRAQTGLSFGLWRQKVRLLDSIRLLAEGKSVTEAAIETGYTSVSAFIASFKSTFGHTPGRL